MDEIIPTASVPYCGPAPTPASLLSAWNLDPLLLVLLLGATLAAALHLRQVDGTGHRQRVLAVAAGLAAVAFVSPLCALTVALFAARGLHHLLLIGALAPALALALPWTRAGLTVPFWTLSAALWLWHLPPVYALAWDHAAVYWLMQMALLLPAWAMWSAVLQAGRDGLLPGITAAVPVAALAGQMGLVGAILTFAPRPLFPEHLVLTAPFGLQPLADQQLAGLVMWVPGMLPLALVAGLILHAGWRAEGARA